MALQNNSKAEHDKLVKEFGIQQGAKICRELLADGHYGLHLYSLNLEQVTYGVMKELGLLTE